MTAIAHGHVYGAGLYSQTTAATWDTKLSLTDSDFVGSSGWEANEDYWVVLIYQGGGSNTGSHENAYSLFLGSTQIALSNVNQEPQLTSNTDLNTKLWVWEVSQGGTTEDLHFRMYGPPGTEINWARNVRMVAIKKSLFDGYESTIDTSGPTALTTSPVTRATLSWTPTAGTDWIVFATTHQTWNGGNNNINTLQGLELQVNGGGYTNMRRDYSQEAEDVREEHVVCQIGVIEDAAANQHDVRVQTWLEASGNHDYDAACIVAIELDQFESYSIDEVASPGIPTTWADADNPMATVSHTPATTGDHLIFGMVSWEGGASGVTASSRFQFDGTSSPTDWENQSEQTNDSGDIPDLRHFTKQSIATSGDTIDFDALVDAGTTSMADAVLVAFSLELVSAGGSVLKVEGETAQVSDTESAHQVLVRLLAETTSLSELDLAVRSLVRDQAETISLSEFDIAARIMVRLRAESTSLSELDFAVLGLIRIADESTDLSESDLKVIGLVKLLSETTQLSEQDLLTLELVRLETETLQLSDTEIALRALVRLTAETTSLSEAELKFVVGAGPAVSALLAYYAQLLGG